MNIIEIIAQDVFDKIRSRFTNLEMGDEEGGVTSDPRDARFFDFDFAIEGNNLGRVSISINERGSLKIYYGQGILEGSDPITQGLWYDFLKEMRFFAKRRMMRFDTRDITKGNLNKSDFQYLAANGPKEDNMTESNNMYGSSKSSYRKLENTRLIIRHSKKVNEEQPGSRSRNINALFVENQDGERFKYPFIHLAGAKAMQRHVANGGLPHDPAGKAIINLSEKIAQLNAFKRHVGRHDGMNSEVNEIVERSAHKLDSLKKECDMLSRQGYYEQWKENFVPIEEAGAMDPVTMEDYKSKFTVKQFDEDLTGIFPLIHSIMQETGELDLEDYTSESTDTEEKDAEGKVKGWSHEGDWKKVKGKGKDPRGTVTHMSDVERRKAEKEEKSAAESFDTFESWANAIAEGTLTPDIIASLKDLFDTGLTLGVDGTSAIEALQGIGIDDEDLEAALAAVAKINPDTDPTETIIAWLQKNDPEAAQQLGVPAPGTGVDQPQEPVTTEDSIDEAARWGDMNSGVARTLLGVYRHFAPGIEKYQDEAGADQLYKEMEKVAAKNQESSTFNSLIASAQGYAHQEYDTNPGHFKNWFWFVGDFLEKIAEPDEDGGIEVGEAIDPANPRDYDKPAYLRKKQGQAPLTHRDVKDKDEKAKRDYHARAGIDSEEGMENEEPEHERPNLKEIAEVVKSFYDKETGKFPKGETGVVMHIKKQFGDHAGQIAERFVEQLSQQQQASEQEQVEVQQFEDIKRLAGLAK